MLWWKRTRVFELLGRELVQHVAHALLDHVERDARALRVAWGCRLWKSRCRVQLACMQQLRRLLGHGHGMIYMRCKRKARLQSHKLQWLCHAPWVGGSLCIPESYHYWHKLGLSPYGGSKCTPTSAPPYPNLCSVPQPLLPRTAGSLLHGGGGELVEGRDVAHHLHALVEGAVLVVLGEAVLLQVVVLDVAGQGRGGAARRKEGGG